MSRESQQEKEGRVTKRGGTQKPNSELQRRCASAWATYHAEKRPIKANKYDKRPIRPVVAPPKAKPDPRHNKKPGIDLSKAVYK
jgi:hypothetical protein